MADVFSIITTLQALEKAYIKDVVEPAEYVLVFYRNYQITLSFRYTRNCEKLLAKFAAAFRQIEGEFPSIDNFVHKYKVKLFLFFINSKDFYCSLIVLQLYYVFVKVVLLLFEMIVVIWAKLLLKQFQYEFKI
jgi:hypothetical protein